jgi:hypothetical protein
MSHNSFARGLNNGCDVCTGDKEFEEFATACLKDDFEKNEAKLNSVTYAFVLQAPVGKCLSPHFNIFRFHDYLKMVTPQKLHR